MAKRKIKSQRPQPELEEEYWDEIELIDPFTGEKVKQKVKIKRYKSIIDSGSAPREDDVVTKLNSSTTSFTYEDE